MLDDEILQFAVEHAGHIPSVLPLLDHLARVDRLYRVRRVAFAGHRWIVHELPTAVAGFLTRRLGELRFDETTRTWSWTGTQWTDNIKVR
jgi:hypothetical protein